MATFRDLIDKIAGFGEDIDKDIGENIVDPLRRRFSKPSMSNVRGNISNIKRNFNTSGNLVKPLPITNKDVQRKSIFREPILGGKIATNFAINTLNKGGQLASGARDFATRETVDPSQSLGQELSRMWSDVGKPGALTGAQIALQGKAFSSPSTLLKSTGPYMGLNTSLTGLLGAAQGKDKTSIAQDISSGFDRNLQMTGLISVTNPATENLLKNLGVENFFASSAGVGLSNVFEDEVIAAINNDKNTWENRLVAFLIPGIMSGGGKALGKISKPVIKAFQNAEVDKILSDGVASGVVKATQVNGQTRFSLPDRPQWMSKTDAIDHIRRMQEATKNVKVDTSKADNLTNIRKQLNTLSEKVNSNKATNEDIVKINRLLSTLNDNDINAMGAVAGVEVYRDEQGRLKARYNPSKGAIGLALGTAAGRKSFQDRADELAKNLNPEDVRSVRENLAEMDKIKRKQKAVTEINKKINGIRDLADKYKAKATDAYSKGEDGTGKKYWSMYKEKIDNIENLSKQRVRKGVNNVEPTSKGLVEEVQATEYTVKDSLENIKTQAENTKIPTERTRLKTEALKQLSDNYSRLFSRLDKAGDTYGYKAIEDFVLGVKEAPEDIKPLLSEIKDFTKQLSDFRGLEDKGIFREDYGIPHVDDAQVFSSKIGLYFVNSRFKSIIDIYNPLEARTNPDFIGDARISDRLRLGYLSALDDIMKDADKLDLGKNADLIKQVQEGSDAPKTEFNKKIGIYGERMDRDPGKLAKFVTSKLESQLRGWEDIGLRDEIITPIQLGMYNNYKYTKDLVDIYTRSGAGPFIQQSLDMLGLKKGTQEYNDLMGLMVGKFGRSANDESKDKLAWALAKEISTEVNINRPLVNLENWLKTTEITDPKTREFVNDSLKSLLSGGYREMSGFEKAIDFVRRWASLSQLGGKVSTALLQPFETIRAFSRYGPINASRAVAEITTGSAKNFEEYKGSGEVGYIMGNGKKIERSKVDKAFNVAERVGYKGISMTEGWKNSVFLRAAELQGIQKGLEGKKLDAFVLKEFQDHAHNYDNMTVPQLLQNPIAKFFGMYTTYPVKQIGLLARTVENIKIEGIGKTESRYLAAMMLASYMQMKIFNWLFRDKKKSPFEQYGYADALSGGLPGYYNPIVDINRERGQYKLGGLVGNAIDFNRARQESAPGEYDYERSKRNLTRQAYRTLIPGGNQALNVTGTGLKTIKRGYAETPTGGVAFPAPEKTSDKIRSVTLSPYATEEAQRTFELQDQGISTNLSGKNQIGAFKKGGKPVYEDIIADRMDKKELDDMKKKWDKEGGTEYVLNDMFYYKNDDGNWKEIPYEVNLERPELSGSSNLDYEVLKDHRNEVRSRMNDVTELYKRGAISASQAQSELLRLQAEYDTTDRLMKVLDSSGSGKKISGKNTKGKAVGSKELGMGDSGMSRLIKAYNQSAPPKIGNIKIDIEGIKRSVDSIKPQDLEFNFERIKLPKIRGIR